MNKIIAILIPPLSLTFAISIVIGNFSPILAQTEDDNSQEILQQENWQIQQETPTLEQEQQEEKKEEQLEQELQINNNTPREEELPAPPESTNPNVPQSPESEVEIKF